MTDQTQPAQEPTPVAEEVQTATEQTPAPASTPKIQTEDDERFFSALGYFGPLFIVTLIVKPKSLYCRFHAKQSMILFLLFFITLIVLALIPMIGSLLTLALFALYVIAIYRAYQGDMWNIPFVSTFAGKVDVDSLYKQAGLAMRGVSDMKEKAGSLAEKTGATLEKMGEQKEEENPPAK